jgi:hypothetical protein
MLNEEDIKDAIAVTKELGDLVEKEVVDVDAIKDCVKIILEILEQPKISVERMF